MRSINESQFEISREQIEEAIAELARHIRLAYPNGCTICGVLHGATRVVEALMPHLDHKAHLYPTCFIGAGSYKGENQKKEIILYGTSPSVYLIKKKKVVLVEDIVDSGHTAQAVGKYLIEKFNPAEISVFSLCAKGDLPSWLDERAVGFQLPKESFVIGFGMDYNGHFRDLPVIRPITDEDRAIGKEPFKSEYYDVELKKNYVAGEGMNAGGET